MHQVGPNWRDRYYATDLDVVLASVMEMDNRQSLDDNASRQRNKDVNAIPDTTYTWPESVSIPTSIPDRTLIGSPLSTMTDPIITCVYSPTTQPSSTTSPESSFSAPTPSSSSIAVARCPLCPVVFTGSVRDRNSNLRRHMRTTRDHGNAVGLLCTVSGCGAILTRSDNLGKHIRTVHGGNTGAMLRRHGAKRRKGDNNGVE